MFKGVLIDVDETVFDYDKTHKKCLEMVYENFFKESSFFSFFSFNSFMEKLNESVSVVKTRINTHNKLFYFQDLVENLEIENLNYFKIYDFYKKSFLDNLELKGGIKELLEYFVKNEVKVCFVTNYNSYEQLEKLNKMFSFNFYFVSCEEVGVDKPHPFIYNHSLSKLKLLSNEVIFIGNNFNDDILGPNRKNIFSCYYNQNCSQLTFKPNYIEYSDHKELLNVLNILHLNVQKFIDVSKYYGMNEDLIQGGGGNISLKFFINENQEQENQELIIVKASGFNLSEITLNKGYCIFIRNDFFLNKINDFFLNSELSDNEIDKLYLNSRTWIKGSMLPSIETLLHIVMNKKYVIHYHNLCEIGNNLNNKIMINYVTPGFLIVRELIKNNLLNENYILLKNHGTILQCDEFNEKFEKIELKHDYEIEEIDKEIICEVFPCTPDMALYCGEFLFEEKEKEKKKEKENKRIKIFLSKTSVIYYCNNISELRNMKLIFEQFMKNYKHLYKNGVRKLSKEEIDKLFSWSREIKRLDVK